MNKFLLPALLLSTPILITLPILPHQVTNASKTQARQTFAWATFSQILFSKKPPVKPRKGGSRLPTMICMVSPDAPPEPRVIWNDRPVFIWQGSVQKVAVRLANSQEDLWSQPVTGSSSIKYTGKALQPGQKYEWIVNSSTFVPFQVMEAQHRDTPSESLRERITSELKTLENQLKADRADTEAIALAKTNYFVKNQLWSDALQEAYSVEQPSAELAEIRTTILNQLCNEGSSEVSHSTLRTWFASC